MDRSIVRGCNGTDDRPSIGFLGYMQTIHMARSVIWSSCGCFIHAMKLISDNKAQWYADYILFFRFVLFSLEALNPHIMFKTKINDIR